MYRVHVNGSERTSFCATRLALKLPGHSGPPCADRYGTGMGDYFVFSIFQNTGVAGPPSTPVSDFRHALGALYCPSGM
jgi:hypothetical protein